MKNIYLYHLEQDNIVKYVGLTIDKNRRASTHKKYKPPHIFSIKNCFYNAKKAAIDEIKHIEKHKTFYNGWNKTKGGEGYFMGLVDRKGIGGVRSGNIPWNKGKKNCFSEETIKRFKETRKGIIYSSKLNEKIVKEIREFYDKKPKVNFEVNKVMRNGKKMSYKQAFSKTYHTTYGLTSNGLKKIVEKKSWHNV
jgi:hypothetical protein|tara:strand:+ start:133 stop:714 length:582 start_codon:yes stop_codon:yes gene_type:complete